MSVRTPRSARALLARLPAADPGPRAWLLWLVALGAGVVGIVGWATWTLQGGVIALWAFTVAGVAVALVLPLPAAFVAPLFAGLAGWLVDMLPFVILVSWATVCLRWALGVLRKRRLPVGGRWIWLPIGLAAWTVLGVTQIDISLDGKHFALLLAIQLLSSATLLAIVDALRGQEQRIQVVTGLVVFIVVMSIGVFAEWVGAPIQELQNSDIRSRVEETYGVDAFPNNLGMMKYARSSKAGAREVRAQMDAFARTRPELPDFEVFLPKFQAFDGTNIVVRFDGSARSFEDDLQEVGRGVDLVYDNVGLIPANTVPRMRSFARNSLTYAGSCVALFFVSFFLAWRGAGRKRLLGWLGVASSLFGAAFSLARGAWVAIPIGIAYLFVDGRIEWRKRWIVLAAALAAGAVLTITFLVKYDVDPINARAGGDASIATRSSVYEETIGAVDGVHLLLGYGTERPRTESGASHELGRYIPKAGTHSTYLNYLFRTGVPGALAIMAIYAAAALHARAAAR
ncbi:MAG TPA: O-antigen ligase family protein, partial [Vicinamibacterales bacterium]|nr:O-antigen ligase family protein [Vicinamibacterales bacterium]